MHPAARAFMSPILFVVALAGCVEDEKANDYEAAATDGYFTVDFAYDGRGVQKFVGAIHLQANDAANTGVATVVGTIEGTNKLWVIVFDEYAEQPGKPFQDGGIARGLDEHGDTGVGDTSIPKVSVETAAWGKARIFIDGVPYLDPFSQNESWAAHYMVIKTGVRDEATHGIYQDEAMTKPYDPKTPSEGYAKAGDDEVHLVLKPTQMPPANGTSVDFGESSAVTESGYAQSFKFDNAYRGSVANFTIALAASPSLAPTSIVFSFKNPAGTEVARVTSENFPQPMRTLRPVFGLHEVGEYTIDVSGRLVGTTYSITGPVEPPKDTLMNFWWENVVFGEAAEQFRPTDATPGNGTGPM